ncbi:HAMP domain-containing histidine kinase [Paenibacillus alba]|uniref:ATP-binding protein n=1 Tax=Paenibacillus alba TaxID=1197127 RepID=UPI0015656E66|nr:HAMP domain-containing histidine kinase [Paenibacillus alba]
MIFTFIVLWLIAIILIINNPHNESTRWAAFVAFCGGAGGFARALIEDFSPVISLHQLMDTELESILHSIYNIGSFINTYGLPYGYLIFCLCYSELFGRRKKAILKAIMFGPVILMFYITPLLPEIIHNYPITILWVAPYILIGSGLLIFSYYKETNPLLKKSRLFTNLIALPPVLFQLVSNYTLRLFSFDEVWRLNAIMMFFLLVLFIVLMIKFDFFGVKLRFERRRIDSTLKAVTSGTSFLNHAIKNEVGKISILAENIQHLTSDVKNKEVSDNVSHILASADHLLEMINRIQHQIQDIFLRKERNNLSDLLHECVALNQTLLNKKRINIEEHYALSRTIEYDSFHLKEVINNLLANAIDAMNSGGLMRVEAFELRNQVYILVKDSGIGISKSHLEHIFDPFFTTKMNKNNFGLGLSYCFNVIRKHGGKIEVFSELEKGTTVKVSLPVS